MTDKENFDDLIRQKVSEKEFPFDEKNWEKAAAMIDASRGSSIKWPFIAITAALVVSLGIFIPYYLNTNDTTTLAVNNEQQASNKINTTELTAVGTNFENQDVKPANEEKEITLSDNKTSENAESNTVTETKEESVTDKTNTLSKSEKEEVLFNDNRLNAKENNSENNTGVSKKQSSSLNKSEKQTSTELADKSLNEKQKDKTNGVLGEKTQKFLDQLNASKQNSGGETNKKEISNTKNVNQPDKSEDNSSESKIKTNENVASSGNKNQDNVNSETDKQNDNKPETKEEKEPVVAPSENNAAKLPESSQYTRPGSILSIEAGASYLFGWNNTVKNDATGINPLAGINFSYMFGKTKKIGISSGVQYNSVNNIKSSTFTCRKTQYDFGAVNETTEIITKKLHYIYVPLKLIFGPNVKNTFGAGCNFGYLLNSVSNTETYTQTAFTRTAPEVTKSKGYYEGYSKADIQLSLSYKRTIYKNLSVSVEFLYGIKDIKNNAFFNAEENNSSKKLTENNKGFKLIMSYDLFKK